MHDILFRIPLPGGKELPIHSYGVMAMVGFLAAILVARWRARRAGVSVDTATDVALWALFAGIIGSRVAYVLLYPQDIKTFADVFKIWEGGLVFYGGFIAATIVVLILLRIRNERILAMLDVLAPSLALGQAFGRIGCFLRGCCYGAPVRPGAWYGIVFPPDSVPYCGLSPSEMPVRPALFPTQILSALDLFVIFLILSLFFKRRRAEGQVVALCFMLVSVERFIMEFYRGDTHAPGHLSNAQWISIVAFFAGLGLMVYAGGRARQEGLQKA